MAATSGLTGQTEYIRTLKKRAKESRVYKKYQMIGLEIAEILHDRRHKSLYIKLAKESALGGEKILRLAKEIAEKKNVRNKGAYFMKLYTLQKTEFKKNGNRK